MSFLEYGFMKHALLAICIITPLFGILGTMIVNNRMAFFSDALGHSALTGMAIGDHRVVTRTEAPRRHNTWHAERSKTPNGIGQRLQILKNREYNHYSHKKGCPQRTRARATS